MHRTHKVSPGTFLSVFKGAEQTFSKAVWIPSAYIRKREKGRRRYAAPRWSSRSRWSALRPTNVIGRTLIASEPIVTSDGARGGQKVSGRRKDPLARVDIPAFGSGKGRREFSRIISKLLSTYPPHFPRFSSDFAVSFVYPTSPRCSIFRPQATGYRIFEWLSRIRKAIAEHEITSASRRRLFRFLIDTFGGHCLSANRSPI